MRIAALVEGLDHVCCRYRLAAFEPYFVRAGHQITYLRVPRHVWQWPGVLRRVRAADLVIVQRKLPNAWQRRLLRRSTGRLAFDFDDAVFLRDSFSARGLQSGSRRRRFEALVRDADLVIAGNSFLRDQAVSVAGKDKVDIIPTCVDPIRYPLARHVRFGNGVQLVWVGSSSTLRGLERVKPLLETIGQQCPGVRLKLICDRFLTLAHLPVIACPWSEEKEAKALAAADVGISWVPDDRWSQGKCGLKVLQYMAAGLPVVANPVGVQKEMVRHGETGFLAGTPAEWVDAVGRLAADPILRRRMGRAGRNRLEVEYSTAAGAERWAEVLDRLLTRRQSA